MTHTPYDLDRHDGTEDALSAVHSGRPLLVMSEEWAGKSLAVSPDGNTLALGGNGAVLLWNMTARRVIRKLKGRRKQDAHALLFSSDGYCLLACFKEDNRVRVYDTRTGKVLRSLESKGEQLDVEQLIRHPTHDLVFAGVSAPSGGKEVIAWQIATGEIMCRFRVYPMCFGELNSLALSSDGCFLAICREDDNDIRVIRTDTGDRIFTLWGHTEDVTSLSFVGGENWLVSASEDQTVRLWDLSSGKESRRFLGHDNWIKQVCTTTGPSGTLAYSAGWDSSVHVWDLVSGNLLRRLQHHKNIDVMLVTPDGRRLITSGKWTDWLVCWNLLSTYDDLDHAVDVTLGGSESTEAESPRHQEEEQANEEAETSLPSEFADSAWTLPTSGEVEWQSLIELCGQPRESTILTDEEWKSAKHEHRVVTIHYSDTGRSYYARVGLHKGNVMCRAVFSCPLPLGVVVQNVDLDDIDWDFESSVVDAAQATDLLMRGVRENDLSRVEAAVRAGADVDFERGQPLSIAVENGYLEVVKLLVEEGGADLSGDAGPTLWRKATLHGHDHIAHFLVTNKVEPPMEDTLLEAVYEDNRNVVEKLLESGARIDASAWIYAPHSLQGTPLTVAAGRGHGDLVRFLLAKGANPNARDRQNITPWVAAVAAGSATIQAALEAAGGQPNLQGALLRGSQLGNAAVIQRLIDQGADVNSRAIVGAERLTPLEAVCANSELSAQKRVETVECLLERGADPNTRTGHGRPLTFRAVDQMQSDVLIALLRNGADTELQDKKSGETALVAAVEQNKTDCAKALLMAGANTKVRNRKGQPLLIAMLNGECQPQAELAKWLIAYGADVNTKDSAGRTVKQYAKRIVRKRDDDDYAADQAQAILELLGNAEGLARNSGVFAGTPTSATGWFARADCALTWLEELSLAIDALAGAVRADSRAVSGLNERLADGNLAMRFAAAHAIAALSLGAAAAASTLIERLRTEEDSDVALAVTGALVAIGSNATEPLMESLRTGTTRTARRAAITLCGISPTHCKAVTDTLHRRGPADRAALAGDALREAAEWHGICGDAYAFIGKLPEAMHEYEASVAINPDVTTGRKQALTFARWKLGVPLEGMIENSIGMRFATIPSGEFMMGAPEDEPGMNAGEELLHRVRITRPFYIGVCAVSQEEYARVMGDNPSRFQDPALPVEHVSWRQAMEFCKKLSQLPEEQRARRVYRLPTEAEWEYACRAGRSTPFSFGDAIDHNDANFCDDSVITPQPTVPVGSLPPNAFGLHEMHGNVWEWCRDWYQVDYYEQSPCDDPPGPEAGHHHVMRGGSASVMAHECRAAMRGEAAGPPVDTPDDAAGQRFQRIGDFGFRVVCDVHTSDQ